MSSVSSSSSSSSVSLSSSSSPLSTSSVSSPVVVDEQTVTKKAMDRLRPPPWPSQYLAIVVTHQFAADNRVVLAMAYSTDGVDIWRTSTVREEELLHVVHAMGWRVDLPRYPVQFAECTPRDKPLLFEEACAIPPAEVGTCTATGFDRFRSLQQLCQHRRARYERLHHAVSRALAYDDVRHLLPPMVEEIRRTRATQPFMRPVCLSTEQDLIKAVTNAVSTRLMLPLHEIEPPAHCSALARLIFEYEDSPSEYNYHYPTWPALGLVACRRRRSDYE